MNLVDLRFSVKLITLIMLLSIGSSAGGYTGITVETGGGFSSNLYADSFSLGDSYFYGAFSLANTQFNDTKLKFYYDLGYYGYESRNSINQMNHLAGVTLFRKKYTERIKWSIDLAGTYRDYTEDNSDYDNYKLFLGGYLDYSIAPGLQLKGLYQLKHMSYSGFDNLDHLQHRFKSEISKTLPSRTTIKGKAEYFLRDFTTDNSQVDWLDLEFKLSQSIDIRTGISGSGTIRFAGNNTRPLSSYYIVSGVTPYWDPWDGYQLNFFVKRILPKGIIGTANFYYWNREFSYSEAQQNELPWLAGQTGRNDDGWQAEAEFTRQINIFSKYGRALKISLAGGYSSNSSDDDYYSYDNYHIDISLKYDIR